MDEVIEIIAVVAANSAFHFLIGCVVGRRSAIETPDGRLARFLRWLDQPRRMK